MRRHPCHPVTHHIQPIRSYTVQSFLQPLEIINCNRVIGFARDRDQNRPTKSAEGSAPFPPCQTGGLFCLDKYSAIVLQNPRTKLGGLFCPREYNAIGLQNPHRKTGGSILPNRAQRANLQHPDKPPCQTEGFILPNRAQRDRDIYRLL
ncbi:MAG: hypothetical protein RLZZ338_2070 [Cyanobacteriota bacterium]